MNNGVTIIIPAYNEEAGLPSVLDDIKALGNDYEVIVVDDGSTDNTAQVAKGYGAKVWSHRTNQGKGSALLSGVALALHESIIWIDADGSYPVSMIPKVVSVLIDGCDGVVCSRLYGRENIPKFNRIGNSLFSVLIRMLYGFTARDPCTGLYAMKKRHLVRMGLRSKRFTIEPEISIKSGRMKLRLAELPIRYEPRIGDTKLNGITVGLADLFTIAKLIFWRPKYDRNRGYPSILNG